MLYYVSVEFNKDFVRVDGNQIAVGVKAKPIGGEANKEVIKKIAKHFGVSSAGVTIKSGHRSKDKIVQVS